MAALGGVPDVHTSATGHEVMITAPRELAGFLLSVLD